MVLTRKSFAQLFNGRRHLLLADALVLLSLGGRLKSLPRQTPAQEVHEHVTQRLHVIAATLFFESNHQYVNFANA